MYPSILSALEYVEDRFGRKYIMCLGEQGRTEKIFTDRPIDPMKSYFLLPLTNPVRVYPYLVEYVEAE